MSKILFETIFSGAVLAGGKSTRMGRNKALLRIEGEPLWRRQLRLLKEAGANPVWLVQAPGQRALSRSVLRDTVRDAGPLAGLHAALTSLQQESCGPARPQDLSQSNGERSDSDEGANHLAVLAVDLPHLFPAWFRWLAKNCSPTAGAVVRTPRGYEPLAAIYPQSALLAATAALTAGEYSLQKFVTTLVRTRRLKVLRLPATDRWQLANWNSPEDLPR